MKELGSETLHNWFKVIKEMDTVVEKNKKTGKFVKKPKTPKPVDRSLPMLSVYSEGMELISALADEYQEWYDNASGTALEAMEKFTIVEEVAGDMSEQFARLEELEFPEDIKDVPVIIPLYPKGKSPSKAVRLNYACIVLRAVGDVIVDDSTTESGSFLFKDIEDETKRRFAEDQADEFAEGLQDILDELDSIELP
jgi:uncharacterized protein (DUF934 family)